MSLPWAMIEIPKVSAVLLLSLAMVWITGCENFNAGLNRGSGNLSQKELEQIRGQLVAHPVPSEPTYGRTRQKCFFFVPHPDDGSMVPIGVLQRFAYLIVRSQDGDWTDVQLTSGQVGSVLSVNMRNLTDVEEENQEYLDPQPDLQPLSLPQAQSGDQGIDPSLLGG